MTEQEQQLESLAEKAVFSLAKGVEALAAHGDNAPAWFAKLDLYKKEIDKILTHPIETDDDYRSLGELVEDESEDAE